jgi:hypothetical protein
MPTWWKLIEHRVGENGSNTKRDVAATAAIADCCG